MTFERLCDLIRDRRGVLLAGLMAAALSGALAHTGHAVLLTSLILAVGFASMGTSDLLAIRDMDIVGAVVMVAALPGDVLLAPALYLLAFRPATR